MSTLTPIYDITPFTLLDYPDKVACIIWFSGCNMRCLYCYNPDLVLGKGKISYAEVLSFLQSRKGMLEAVVLSGGECTMHGDLIELIKAIRVMGFLVKVDTNGSRPLVIEQLVREQLVDYLAVDFKAMPQNFAEQTGSDLFASFEHTLTFLVASQQSFEVRTTVHDDLIDNADFNKMVVYLVKMKYTGTYYVQHFVNNVRTLAQLGFSNKQLKKSYQARINIDVVFR